MSIETRTVTLSNPLNNLLVQKIIDLVGTEVTEELDYFDKENDPDDVHIETKFPQHLMIMGDDSWGGVTRIYMHDEETLCIVANFGDDGDVEWYSTADDWQWAQIGILTAL